MTLTNKTLIRFGSFASALMLAVLGFAFHSRLEMNRYKRQLELQQLRSLQELSSDMNAITVDLQKSAYAGTTPQLSAIAAKVWRDSGAAKAAMGNLPADGLDLDDIYRFLSQVGDYTMYLSRKSLGGEEITQEERDSLEALGEYARRLNNQIGEMESRLSSGQISLGDLLQEEWGPDGDGAEALTVSLDYGEQQPDSYPSLIYDGPFSDHMLRHQPTLTKNKPELTLGKSVEIAASYLGLTVDVLDYAGEEQSHMPCHIFTGDGYRLGITKAGGYVAYFTQSREIGGKLLSIDEGRALARDYLERQGAGSMLESYYQLSGGVLTVNFAWLQDNVTCYTDLIKVGIAMDTGQVVFYDARGFIGNHRDRELEEPSLPYRQTMGSISPNLEPKTVRLALIPTSGGEEKLTYEFRCKGKEGEDVLVYLNVHTGAEENILILLENEQGTLAI